MKKGIHPGADHRGVETARIRTKGAGARAKITASRDEYNGERPHSSLGYRTPNEFAAKRGRSRTRRRREIRCNVCLALEDFHCGSQNFFPC